MIFLISRIRQGFIHLFGRLKPSEKTWAKGILTPEEWKIFEGMHPADRYHGVRVAQLLENKAPAWVLRAALLHDCGKPPSFGLLARTGAVLFGSRIKQEHPARGAARLEGMLPPEGIELVLRHHEEMRDLPWLLELQDADSRN